MDMFDDGLPDPVTQELPLPGYKHLSGRVIQESLTDLDREQVETLRRYEGAHRERTPVMRLLTARIRSLREARRDA